MKYSAGKLDETEEEAKMRHINRYNMPVMTWNKIIF